MEAQMEQEIMVNHEIVTTSPSKKIIPAQSFITANTEEVGLDHLREDCIIPSFSRDNESTISHQEFIESTYDAASQAFPFETINQTPQIRVSHVIKGRIPEAVGKPAKDLLDHEKTIYWERMAFIFEIPSITTVVNGNTLSLTIGGVRSYNLENLYSKKTFEKFKVFVGFKNFVCCNLCVHSDGFIGDLRVSNTIELSSKIFELFQDFQTQKHVSLLDNLTNYELSEKQFAMFLGRSKLYNYLPKSQKSHIPLLGMNDAQISAVAKSYYDDDNFKSESNGSISLWNMYNLITGSIKSSYIDNFLDRTVNAYQLTEGFAQALDGDSKYKWFLE